MEKRKRVIFGGTLLLIAVIWFLFSPDENLLDISFQFGNKNSYVHASGSVQIVLAIIGLVILIRGILGRSKNL